MKSSASSSGCRTENVLETVPPISPDGADTSAACKALTCGSGILNWSRVSLFMEFRMKRQPRSCNTGGNEYGRPDSNCQFAFVPSQVRGRRTRRWFSYQQARVLPTTPAPTFQSPPQFFPAPRWQSSAGKWKDRGRARRTGRRGQRPHLCRWRAWQSRWRCWPCRWRR